jgi:hypothetical protein
VLREVFDFDYDEIAAAVDRTAAAVRQIAHRARGHVEARRTRTRSRWPWSERGAAAWRSGGPANSRWP